jgi:hypothetical protein
MRSALSASTRAVVVVLAGLFSATSLAAQEHVHTPGMTHPASVQRPTQGGQAAFAAIAEIVAMLQADVRTDWSKVNIERLRLHLADMDLVTLRSRVVTTPVTGGAQFLVRGTGETIAAIKRMTGAHVAMVMNSGGPRVVRTELPDGVRLIVTAADPSDRSAVSASSVSWPLAIITPRITWRWPVATRWPTTGTEPVRYRRIHRGARCCTSSSVRRCSEEPSTRMT